MGTIDTPVTSAIPNGGPAAPARSGPDSLIRTPDPRTGTSPARLVHSYTSPMVTLDF
ncbi:hypothetical protein BN2537_5999 [Streptomyces venezuelae]|nr:hypothetical protein BN2537_5999 [Streptomyces venezuelae]